MTVTNIQTATIERMDGISFNRDGFRSNGHYRFLKSMHLDLNSNGIDFYIEYHRCDRNGDIERKQDLDFQVDKEQLIALRNYLNKLPL